MFESVVDELPPLPELSDDAGDQVLVFFDPNHGAGGAPASDDRALRFVGFPSGGHTPSTAEIYSGTGAAWR